MLVSTIELFARARRGDHLGIRGSEQLGLDWPAVISRKDKIVASWSESKNATPAKLGVPVLRGHATFARPHEVTVDGRNYSAEKIVIATGSKPARPPIAGAELGITSDELIHLKEQPRQLVVIGGGFIGLEFGFALARAGTKVTVLQSGPEIGPALDHDIRNILLECAGQAGMTIKTNMKVTRIRSDKRSKRKPTGARKIFPPIRCCLPPDVRPMSRR